MDECEHEIVVYTCVYLFILVMVYIVCIWYVHDTNDTNSTNGTYGSHDKWIMDTKLGRN